MDKILVLDFGGQYAHLISRRFRNMGYFSEIAMPDIDENEIKSNVKGIVLSGGPASVYDKNAPYFNNQILKLDIPILGLCYGHQLIVKEYDGIVENTGKGEYGFTVLNKEVDSPLFKHVAFPTQVWMSHSDTVKRIPEGFESIGSTLNCDFAALHNIDKKIFTLQFHPEVKDTVDGDKFLNNFAHICKMKKNWDSTKLLDGIKEYILTDVKGGKNVLLFLSGGVDSSVAFAVLTEVLGQDRVLGLYINNGFMRKNETDLIKKRYQKAGFKNILFEDFGAAFLKAVENVVDPQEKRKRIGETFLKVRDEVIEKLDLKEDEWLLGQGTLYPDIIESGGTKHSNIIKTHHNRVEGIKQLLEKGLIVEPLKELYKDEVRVLGRKLGLPDVIINRQPFPGPGISINLLCSKGSISDINDFKNVFKKLEAVDLNNIIVNKRYKLSLLPVKSVGVQGDFRTYSYPAVLELEDGLDNFIGWDIIEKISSAITNSIKEVNRVVLKLFVKKECRLIEAYCTRDRLDMIREVDDIVMGEIKNKNKYDEIFQHLTINIPYASSNNSCSIVLRPVVSEDVMTARFARFEIELLEKIIKKINKLDFVDSLYYDITNKPPATFGWE